METVYNIEVEEDHTYTVNNFICYNCTYWSIAQSSDKRETVASGLGWELFSQYVNALHKAKPKYFLYENNKSMSSDIRKSIYDTFGFEPILINSSLVSAQNRSRLYWVGIRQNDGTYKKADIAQPQNLNITLKDILESGVLLNPLKSDENKSHTLVASYYKAGTEPSAYCSDQASPRVVDAISSQKIGMCPNNAKRTENTQSKNKVYTVKNREMTVKDVRYPIKLADGQYTIRKLTIRECARLQTVPEWVEFPVSNTQAYKQIGNGWTVEVIKHLIQGAIKNVS